MDPLLLDLELAQGAEQYWEAYWRLHRSRGSDMGEVIALREADIVAHAAAFGFGDMEEFYEMITAMDTAYLEFHRTRPRSSPVGDGTMTRPPRAG